MNDDASNDVAEGNQIAVIGMAGRFPGARQLSEFWTNLCAGVESVRFWTDEELLAAGEDPELLNDPAYVRAWPVLEDIALFDAGFFGMSPRDAAVMDPQHRFFLEVAWQALENAGYEPENGPGSIGVFAACGMNTYMMYHLVTNREVMETVGEWLVRHTGNDMNFLATRASYQMNLKGPSLNVQTACSSALVAVHLACQSLLNGECDMALAGASTLSLPQDRGYIAKQGEILSADGHCRPFDADSRGTLFGSGTGAVVLRRLSDALADGDQVLAVIRGSAINNDGSQKVGYLAPSVEGQARAVAEALAISGVNPESISYIEAHGTGTVVGDPIEVTALTQAYRAHTDKRGYCGIGSVKANIGHLGEAAGMAGLIKTVLSLQNRKLPPSINYTTPNPEIDFAASPFFVNDRLRDWTANGGALRAGVTALGAGGTNVHLIVEEPPAREAAGPARRSQLLLLSAKTASALERATDDLAAHLEQNPALDLADAAYTLQVGRKHFAHRRTLVCDDVGSAIAALRARDPKQLPSQVQGRATPSVAFMFPGGGAQYAGMGQELYETESEYRKAVDECLNTLDRVFSQKLRVLMFPAPEERERATRELEMPSLALPALFTTEYAAAKLLMSWGVEPRAFIGHSMGEYVAACLAGVFSARDGLSLVSVRGRLFETLPSGGMLSVELPEAELRPLLGPKLSIAAVNGPTLCVASGPVEAIDALESVLKQREVETTRIHISVAAHSSMLEPILKEFEQFCRTIRFQKPSLPFVSNLTGTWIKPEEAVDPLYWVRHLRSTVRFAGGVAALLDGADRVLVEVGPGRTLSSLARQHTPSPTALPTLRHPRETASDVAFLLGTLGRIWLTGAKPDFKRFHGASRRLRVPLPTYPFEHQRYWIEVGKPTESSVRNDGALRKNPDVTDWFYSPSWKRSATPPLESPTRTWLLFCDEAGLGDRLAVLLQGANVVSVVPGDRFAKLSENRYVIRPGARNDYDALVDALTLHDRLPDHIVHLWAVTAPKLAWPMLRGAFARSADFDQSEGFYFHSLLFLSQALGAHEKPLTLSVVSTGLHALGSGAGTQPEKALLLGPARVIPRELPNIVARNIDVELASSQSAEIERVAERLLEELNARATDRSVALRGRTRWVEVLSPLPLQPTAGRNPVRAGGVYLITGGLGGIGLELALHLARTASVKLVLVGRTALPARSEWERFLAAHPASDTVSHRIRKLKAIEAAGSEVLTFAADVADREQMQAVHSAIRERFGVVSGVVHAAGVIDDALISLKTREAASNVISVKARGALVLDQVFGREPLDFFVVFSSVSAVLGLEGQIDYTAANAFLDAFAQRKSAESDTFSVSIGWNAWQEVGMAVALAERPAQAERGRPGSHPALERVALESNDEWLFVTPFSRTKHWLLSEHVVRGADALIPGTGYLELARAALEHAPQNQPVEMRDVTFLSPFAVRAGESRDLRLRLIRSGASAGEFSFFSNTENEPHVTGRITYVERQAPAAVDVAALLARCTKREVIVNGFLPQPFVDFGPRWANVERVAYGDDEAVICLMLPEPFSSDLGDFKLHPAVLDMATGGAQALIQNFDPTRDFFVPFTYGRLTLYRPLTPRAYSHVRHHRNGSSDLALFDVTIYGPAGEVIADVAGFTMKRVGQAFAISGEAQEALDSLESEGPKRLREQGAASRLNAVVRQGILPKEGMDAFDRILAARVGGHVVACSVDLNRWLERLDAGSHPASAAEGSAADGTGQSFARPTLSTTFVAPRNDVERELGAMWQELLGVTQVGVHDDFFELGGQSLVAVRLFNKIRKRYQVDLPLSTLFEAPTIEAAAKIIAVEAGISLESKAVTADAVAPQDGVSHENGAPEARSSETALEPRPVKKSRWSSVVAMQTKGTLPPFFCIAGMGGTLNNLRKLALFSGESRPFYGLQPPGADDLNQVLYSVEELAEHYIREVKAIQPRGPYFLGGYSGGGVAAYEMARRLSAEGHEVPFLGFIDSFSPALPSRSMSDRAKIHLQRAAAQGPKYLLGTINRRYRYERWDLGRRVNRGLGKLFPQKYRYEVIGDSWVVAESRYRPGPWNGKATLFRAREESALSLWTAVDVDEQHGWGRYLLGGVNVELCPGNHSTMCEEPNVRVLAVKLREAIERATQSQSLGSGPLSLQ